MQANVRVANGILELNPRVIETKLQGYLVQLGGFVKAMVQGGFSNLALESGIFERIADFP